MELVYLWVEGYKNIQKQGFCFSSRFECEFKDEYDEDGKLKDNCELIIKPKEHLENFFGKDINVTAIVGENGTGKSNTLESLVSLFAANGIPIDADYKICGIFYDENTQDYYSKDINCPFCSFYTDTMEDLDKIVEKEIYFLKNKSQSFLLHYNYTLDFLDNDENNINFNTMYHKVDNYKIPILLQPNKSDSKIHLNLIDYFATRDMFEFVFKENLPVENIEKFFKPEKFKLSFHFSYIYGESKQDENFSRNTSLFDYIKSCSLNSNLNIHDYDNSNGIEDYSASFENITRDGLIVLTQFYILKKSIRKINLIINKELEESLNILNTNFDTALDIIKNNPFENLFNSKYFYQTYKIEDSFKFIKFLEKQNEDYKLSDKKQLISEYQELIKNLAPWITIDIYNDKDVSLSELSYGQKFMIRFLYSLLNQLRNLNSHSEYKNILILLDEVENGLHPQWQKEFIKLIIDVLNAFLKKYPKRFKFNIIMTSHSPFILSDLPKENVIFLDKFDENTKDKYPKLKTDNLKNNNCIDVSKHINMKPFGANIHTLLSDGFFMSGGLMGEFAKGKISQIKKFYERVKKYEDNERVKKAYLCFYKKKQKEFWKIKTIIGEPFLKTIIGNYLDEIEKILFEDKAKDLKISRLQKEIDELSK